MRKRIVAISVFFLAAIAAIIYALFSFEKSEKKIVILYTTDSHAYINNVTTGDDKDEIFGLNFAKVAALKNDLEKDGKTVFLVDSGDNIQGDVYGAFDEGKGVREIIALSGMDVSAVGNHEFDYGLFRAFDTFENSGYPYVSCNFTSLVSEELMIPAYEIIERNGIRVGFVGVSTPETITSTTPIYFKNEKGEMIYDFATGENGKKLYDSVQNAVDEIRDDVDYVVLLSHLGDLDMSAPYRVSDVISNTTGIDVVLDGHSHQLIEKEYLRNKDGKTVIKSQAGSYLNAVGKMDLSKSTITTEFLMDYNNSDEEVFAATQNQVKMVQDRLGEVVAVLDNPLYINDAEDETKRLIRQQDTNISDFVTDGIYWYFNEKLQTECDMAIVNGGGLRADISAGDFSYLSSKEIQPFSNVICMVSVSGQQIKDMLEWGAKGVGEADFGGLLHVAGAKYTVDTSVKSSVVEKDEFFVSGPTGDYRVKDIMIYNKNTCEYEPLDLEKSYTVAGINYILRNEGNGFSMLKDAELIIDYIDEDYLSTAEFAKAFATDDEGVSHINNNSSPLYSYKGYMYDYENPQGSGRLNIE